KKASTLHRRRFFVKFSCGKFCGVSDFAADGRRRMVLTVALRGAGFLTSSPILPQRGAAASAPACRNRARERRLHVRNRAIRKERPDFFACNEKYRIFAAINTAQWRITRT
ncbi:MAG: hypothetical protein K2I43_07225, partial [Alistipes sp.]|nr:hypothetical protein [Alistipes sp.]